MDEDDDQGPSVSTRCKKMVIEDDDEILHEIDVFVSKNLGDNLYLLQYPLRPTAAALNPNERVLAKFKENQCKLELKCELNTDAVTYDKNRGEQIAINCNPSRAQEGIFQRTMDYQILKSENIGGVHTNCYAIGFFKNSSLHLNSVKEIIQMRPNFSYLDVADEKAKSATTKSKDTGNSSQDESETEATAGSSAQVVRVKFSGEETDAAKKRRLSSYAYMLKMQAEEQWVPLDFFSVASEQSARLKEKLIVIGDDVKGDGPKFSHDSEHFMRMCVPKAEEDEAGVSSTPSDKVSLAQLRTLPLPDRVQALMTNVKVIQYAHLKSLLTEEADEQIVLKSLQNCAVLVQGSWVVKSELVFPRHAVSPKSGINGEVLCRARDFCLYKFSQNAVLERKEIAAVLKMPADDLQDILKDLARFKVQQKAWTFWFMPDADFIKKFPEIVQRQATFWDAKYQALCHQLNIKRNASSPTRVRHRTGSRTQSISMNTPDDEANNYKASSGSSANKEKASTVNATSANGSTVHSDFELMQSLQKFLYERLSVKPALTLSDLKRLILLKLAESAPGDPLSRGVNDKLIEQCAQQIGALKMQTAEMKEPVFLFTQLSSWPDVRRVLVKYLIAKPKAKITTLKKACTEALEEMPNDVEFRKIIFDYCVQKQASVYLMGTDT